MSTASWQTAERILCVRLDNLGDVLMTTPALCAVKRSARRRHVTLLTSPAGSSLAGMSPDIDRIISYAPPWMKPSPGDAGRGQTFA